METDQPANFAKGLVIQKRYPYFDVGIVWGSTVECKIAVNREELERFKELIEETLEESSPMKGVAVS